MSVATSPDGKHVACGAEDGTVSVFDVGSGKLTSTLSGHSMAVRSLAFSRDSAHLFTGSDDARVGMYDVGAASQVAGDRGRSQTKLSREIAGDHRSRMKWSPRGTTAHWHNCPRVTTAHVEPLVTTAHVSQVATFEGHTSWVLGVAVAPDDSHIATCSSDRTVRRPRVTPREPRPRVTRPA